LTAATAGAGGFFLAGADSSPFFVDDALAFSDGSLVFCGGSSAFSARSFSRASALACALALLPAE
jgi:hypothetical protein